MAVALVATSTSGTTDAQGTSRTCPVPAGAASGMVAVLAIELWQSTATNPVVTWPAGFVEIVNMASSTDGFQKFKAARKVLSAADSGNYSMSWAATHFNQAQCSLWSGVDNTTPLDVAVATGQGTATGNPSTSLTTASAGCGMLHLVANENTSTSTPPTGYTEQQEANYLKTNTKIAGAAGSESISGGSQSTSNLQLAALIALRPASGGGGGSQAISPAAETDTGVTPGRSRTAAAGPALEVDTAITPGRSRSSSPAAAVETDTGITPARARTVAITPALEVDTAVPLGSAHSTPITPALETDQGVTPTRARARTVSPATEIDVAVAPAAARSRPIDPAQETDIAIPPLNPNEIQRDLDWSASLEPARWSATIDPDRWTAGVTPGRWLAEVETP